MSVVAPEIEIAFPSTAKRGSHAGARTGGVIVGLSLFLAAFGPLIAPRNPIQVFPGKQLLPPSGAFPLGTDINGMDILSRLMAAPRTDIPIALLGTLGACLIGIPIGLLSGWSCSWRGGLVMRVSDTIQAFPVFILAMALVVFMGQNLWNVVIVIATVNAPIYVRLTRAQVLVVRERQFIESARSIGGSTRRVLFSHVLPNSVTPALANVSVTIGFSILLTAGLSFVGAGVRVPTPEWGSMIALGAQNTYTGQWWASVFPGIALAITVLGFALLGRAAQRRWHPTAK